MDVLAALAVAVAVFAAVIAVTQMRSRPQRIAQRLERLDRETPLDRNEILALPFSDRAVSPTVRRLGAVATAVLPTRVVAGIDRRLMYAGRPVSLRGFLAMQVLAVASTVGFVLLLLSSEQTGRTLLVMLVLCGAFALAPITWLRLRVAARRQAILRALPDAVDLMVTTVEAGLGIDGALAEVGQETAGPLGEELRTTMRETTLGRSRREALQRLIDRTHVAELRSFVGALIQAEQSGIPIGQVLRVQAAQMRIRRRQLAEAAAQRAPVKMILVLVILVLPAMLLFVVGPAFMRMSDAI